MSTAYENRHAHHDHHAADDSNLGGALHGKARLGFVRKVFGILTAELTFTALWVFLVYNNIELRRFVVNSTVLGVIFGVIAFVGTLTLALSRTIARTVPINYAILGAVVFSMAWSVSYLCAFFPPSTILLAALATASAVGGIYFYALTTTAEYNYGKAFLYSSLGILGFQLLALFFLAPDAYNFWLSVLMSISTCISILYHTEAILGKKSARYTQDDYIHAAMNLYIEIVQLFMELVKIIDKLQKDGEDKKKKKRSD